MAKKLSQDQVDAYRRDGFLGAIPVLDTGEVSRFRAELEAFEATTGKPLDFPERSKSYLLFDWADSIVHHPATLDAVEDVIGPNIPVDHTTMNIRGARNDTYIPWHQDDYYFHRDPLEHVTAWVALSYASRRLHADDRRAGPTASSPMW
jgi:non-heme Fe2+,alpha-ketoglutarate-dependent halogenase